MANKVFNMIVVSGLADALPDKPVNFKQFSIQKTLTIPSTKPDIEQIVSVTAEIVVKNTYVINTSSGTSIEGQCLTGKKLVIEGMLAQKIEYIADEPTQALHSAHFDSPFGTYIVLPPEFCTGAPNKVTGYIEDVYAEIFSQRSLFINAAILLDARL